MRLPRLSLLVLLAAAGCQADLRRHLAPTPPQRPTFSSDTSTTWAGTVEVEAGLHLAPDSHADLPVTWKAGVTPTLEVFAGWSPWQRLEVPGLPDPTGPSDTVLGARHRFLETPGGRSLAWQGSVRLPSGDAARGLGTGSTDAFLAGILTTEANGAVSLTLFYQLGILGSPGRGGADLEHGLALAAGTVVADTFQGFVELSDVFVPERGQNAATAMCGAGWPVGGNLVLDLAVAAGLTADAPDIQILAGLTWNLGGPGRIPAAGRP